MVLETDPSRFYCHSMEPVSEFAQIMPISIWAKFSCIPSSPITKGSSLASHIEELICFDENINEGIASVLLEPLVKSSQILCHLASSLLSLVIGLVMLLSCTYGNLLLALSVTHSIILTHFVYAAL